MPDPIVIELQRLASDGKCPVDELLRKALIVSTKLHISDFTDWIRSELEGYQDKTVPNYRKVAISLKAINPVTGVHMPVFSDGPGESDLFNRASVKTPVGNLSEILTGDEGVIAMPLPNSVQRRLHRACNMPVPMECYRQVSRTAVFGIIDAVRNTILNWSLQLEQEGILGEGMRFTSEEKSIAMTSQSIHIGSFQGILGDVAGSTVTQSLTMSVKPGDFNSLKQQLAEAGISPEDIQSLKIALEAEPEPKSSSEFGPKISAWIGTMMGKAASGAWNVSIETAARLIPAAIAAYYGLG